jgi:hypothetical protein
MSTEHHLTVRASDPLAEISVYDGAFRRVGKQVGVYQHAHPDGIYEIRVRVGGSVDTRLVSLDGDITEAFGPVAFASPIPLADTTGSDEQQRAAVASGSAPSLKLGDGAGLLIVVRDRPGRETYPGSPATGLSLSGPDWPQPIDLSNAPIDPSGQVSLGSLEVVPGVYRLRLSLPNGTARERTLVATSGWTTQCFLVRRRFREWAMADLDQGVVSLNRFGQPFAPDDARARLAETARDALANNRQVAEAAVKALLETKFEDPMLGLLVAHLLLRDRPDDPVLGAVFDNLGGMLGADHPDVRAVAPESPRGPVTEMPMLRASWDRIVRASLDHPGLVPLASPAGEAAARVLPRQPWLVWEPADATPRREESKMAALRSYLSHPADEPSPGSGLAQESMAPPQAGQLDRDQREELTRSLGVPAAVLDDMLSKLGS